MPLAGLINRVKSPCNFEITMAGGNDFVRVATSGLSGHLKLILSRLAFKLVSRTLSSDSSGAPNFSTSFLYLEDDF